MVRSLPRFLRRAARHVLLAVSGALIIGLVMYWSNITGDNNIVSIGANASSLGPRPIVGISLGSAYAAYLFLAIALLIGPWKTIRNERNPISSYLRRDIGIWAAVFAILHTIIALQIYPALPFWSFFLIPADGSSSLSMRLDNFGLANYFGLISTLMLLLLLCLSSDFVLKALQYKRWKGLQRWVYLAAGVTLFHGIIYMIGGQRTLGFVYLFIAISVAMFIGQLIGFVLIKRRANMDAKESRNVG
jgi:sulfoxide reductase heme-binding subunit YedZ